MIVGHASGQSLGVLLTTLSKIAKLLLYGLLFSRRSVGAGQKVAHVVGLSGRIMVGVMGVGGGGHELGEPVVTGSHAAANVTTGRTSTSGRLEAVGTKVMVLTLQWNIWFQNEKFRQNGQTQKIIDSMLLF